MRTSSSTSSSDAKPGAAIADFIYYATPNKAAKALLSDDYTKNPAIFPTDETIARCEAGDLPGREVQRLYDETWTRVLAA